MINNFMCENCNKMTVCKIHDLLCKFSEDAKNPLPVDITMDECIEYSEKEVKE